MNLSSEVAAPPSVRVIRGNLPNLRDRQYLQVRMENRVVTFEQALEELAAKPGVMPLRDLPGPFLHVIDLRNPYPCNNLLANGRLTCPGFKLLSPFPIAVEERSYRTVPLDDLGKDGCFSGVVTPRTAFTIARPSDDVKFTVERAFEAGRRRIAPEAASRLCCLWVVEDNNSGKANIRQMFGNHPSLLMVRVNIVQAIRVTRADTSWFDLYYRDRDPSHINRYWSGEAFSIEQPRWEYLVEGSLKVIDPNVVERIKSHGARFA